MQEHEYKDKEIQQDQREKEIANQQIDIYADLTCAQCNKPIQNGEGLFIKPRKDYQIYYLHNHNCRYFFRRKLMNRIRKDRRKESRLKKCERCDTVFDPGHKRSKRKYCSKECVIRIRTKYYDLYNWCAECGEWILKADSILVPKGTVNQYANYKSKRDKWKCPTCGEKLRTIPTPKYRNKKYVE